MENESNILCFFFCSGESHAFHLNVPEVLQWIRIDRNCDRKRKKFHHITLHHIVVIIMRLLNTGEGGEEHTYISEKFAQNSDWSQMFAGDQWLELLGLMHC